MKYKIKEYPELLEKVNSMDIDDLLIGVICPNVNAGGKPVRNTQAVFLHPTTVEKAVKETEAINRERNVQALIVADMEYGAGDAVGNAVKFPSMRAVAETGDDNLAYQMGAVAAKEALRAGYHWTFGPCVDILGNYESPVVSYRTAGDNPDDVIKYGGAYMRGLQENGLIATIKHFPGDGYCKYDQHITTPENPLSKTEWEESFGRVYSELIDQGVMAIMPGHISLPAFDETDPETGVYPPATVSKNLLTGLLREKLGFEGIIVSDAVNMGGFCGYNNLYEASAKFLEAGGDCLLFMHESEEYLTEMKKHIRSGLLKIETVKNRVYRLMCFSKDYFENMKPKCNADFDRQEAEKIAEKIGKGCVNIVRDSKHILPFKADGNTKIAHFVLYNQGTDDFSCVENLTAKMAAFAGKVDEIRDPGPDRALDIAKNGGYDLIVCSVIDIPQWGCNVIRLSGTMARNMMLGWMKYGTPVVFVAYGSPYLGEEYPVSIDALINTYGYCNYTNDAVTEKIFGK